MALNNILFLFGGTGGLGLQIAKGLVTAEGFDSKKAIVRSIAKASALQEMGWTLVEVADFTDASTLEASLTGAKTVVSAFGGSDMVPLETAAILAAKKVGASLFVPSQFGVDYRRWNTSFPYINAKLEVLKVAKEVELPTLCVFNGYFSETTFDFLADTTNCKARIVGDGSSKFSFTRRSDIGYVLAKALSDPDLRNGGTLSMHGETMSYKEAVETLGGVLGKTIEIEYVDPEDALKQEEELLAKGLEGDMGALYGSFALHLLGVPARGYTGADTSFEAKSYGVKLEKLSETLKEIYGSK